MKSLWKIILPSAIALCACNKAESSKNIPAKLTTQKEKVSYSIGLDIGKSFKQQNIDINVDILHKAILDAQAGGKHLLSDSEVTATMQAFQQEMMAKQDSIQKAKAENNKKAGVDFLAKNVKEADVKTTASGLQYKVITTGTGKNSPKAEDTVTVNYVGTLLDGTEFDSSIKRGQPATFPVGGVIKGWTEALQLMHEGDKFKLFIPSDLAYGERGAGGQIGPSSTLVFEVELLSIKAAVAAAPAKAEKPAKAHK